MPYSLLGTAESPEKDPPSRTDFGLFWEYEQLTGAVRTPTLAYLHPRPHERPAESWKSRRLLSASGEAGT